MGAYFHFRFLFFSLVTNERKGNEWSELFKVLEPSLSFLSYLILSFFFDSKFEHAWALKLSNPII